jgi:hypothetical protein
MHSAAIRDTGDEAVLGHLVIDSDSDAGAQLVTVHQPVSQLGVEPPEVVEDLAKARTLDVDSLFAGAIASQR